MILLFTSLFILILSLISLVLLPLRKVQSYKKDQVTTFFVPLTGYFGYQRKHLLEKGDAMAGAKGSSINCPGEKYMVTNLYRGPVIVLRDPKYIKEFLQKQQYYKKGILMDILKPLIGNGIFAAEGETWKRHRKIISASFHYEFLKSHVSIIQRTAKEILGNITLEQYKDYVLASNIRNITGEIVGKIFFGEDFSKYSFEGKPLTLALTEITTGVILAGRTPLLALFGPKVLDTPLVPRYRKAVNRGRAFRKVCVGIIEDRKANPQKSNDLLASLLATQSSPDPENRFSDEEIVDEFLTFFSAGMDTTAQLIVMTLYNLTQYPQYLQELQEERDNTYNLEEKVTADTLQKMDVLYSLLKETLRFYTPAPVTFGRLALVDHRISDLEVNKGDLVIPEFLASAFDKKNFEDPQNFSPNRWRNNAEKNIDPYAFIPFSAGPRNCIGQHLAMIEAKIVVSEFLEKFEFKLKDGYKLRMGFKILYEPLEDILIDLSSKKLI